MADDRRGVPTSGCRPPTAGLRKGAGRGYIGPMSYATDQRFAPATAPRNVDKVGPQRARVAAAQPPAADQRDVMDTLLGASRLAAFDSSGGDPYNATGRQFRR